MFRFTPMALALVAVSLLGPIAISDTAPAAAQQTETIKRTPLQRFDVPQGTYETVIGVAEIAPDVLIGKHTHPGPESGYVIKGGFTLLVDGQDPRVMQEGESYLIPAGVVHDAHSGSDGAKVIATYVVEKGKPLASPAQ